MIGQDLIEAAFASVPDAILLIDGGGIIRRSNSRAEQMFGYPPGELVGRSIEVLIPPAAREAHRAHRARYAEAPRTRFMGGQNHFQAITRGGEVLEVEIGLGPLEGGARGWVCAVIRDISGRLAMEGRLREQEEALERYRRLEAVGTLAGGWPTSSTTSSRPSAASPRSPWSSASPAPGSPPTWRRSWTISTGACR